MLLGGVQKETNITSDVSKNFMQVQLLTEMYAPNVEGRISCTVPWDHSYGVQFVGYQRLWECEGDLVCLL